MLKADFETKFVNGFHTILREVHLIENASTPAPNSSEIMDRLFDRQSVGSSGQQWRFFDDIVVKYLDSSNSNVETSNLSERLACVIGGVCLCEYDEFLRYIFDIFGSGHNGDLSVQDYTDVLRTILPLHTEDSTLDEHVSSFTLYASSHPLLADQTACESEDQGGVALFPKAIAVQYHSKTHKQLLWPLKVAQEQVKMKFLGVNYWAELHEELIDSSEACALYLPSSAMNFSSYMEALWLLCSAHLNEEKTPSKAPFVRRKSHTSGPDTSNLEILEQNGIYTYRHPLSIGVGGLKNTVSRNAVHLNSPIDQLLRGSSFSSEGVRFPGSKKNPPSPTRRGSLKSLNILIIEDSKLQRKMMRHRLVAAGECVENAKDDTSAKTPRLMPPPPPGGLESRSSPVASYVAPKGWNVNETTTGEEAIQMIIDTKSSFDVIFVDENLSHGGGHMLGHEFVSILRGHKSVLPTTVIIGCSANAEVYVSNFLAAGADAMWQKPMQPPAVIHSEICKYITTRSKYTRV